MVKYEYQSKALGVTILNICFLFDKKKAKTEFLQKKKNFQNFNPSFSIKISSKKYKNNI